MGPWGTFTRVAAAVILIPAAFLTVERLPWNLALTPVWGTVLAGALCGVIGATAENYFSVKLTAAARFTLWAGLAALLLWLLGTYLPGYHLGFWPGAVASLAVGVGEALLPQAVMER